MNVTPYPERITRVGVAVVVRRENRVLFGRRLGAHGAGTWALPGGHLEFGETPERCAVREVLEETGLAIHTLRRGPWTNDVFEAEQRHYVTVFILAEAGAGEPRVMEPDKCGGWAWFAGPPWPQPLFAPLQSLVATGYRLEAATAAASAPVTGAGAPPAG